MKRIVLLLLLCMINFAALGQKMFVKSFDIDPTDMDARVNEPKIDQNGHKAALIKIQTSEKAFGFDTGQLGIVDTEFDKIAEVWVYIPYGAIHLEIKHQQLGIIDYQFPIPIKEATVYNLVLTTSKIIQIEEESAGGEYLQLTVSPSDAEVELVIDNDPPQMVINGEIGAFLTNGTHTIALKSKLFKEYSETINMVNEGIVRTITLQPNFGYFEVNSNITAQVSLNGINVGNTPFKSDKLPLGNYTIELSAQNYETYKGSHTLSEGGKSVTIAPTLSSYLAPINISVPMKEAQILINKEFKGNGSWSGTLMPGSYAVEAAHSGYRSTVKAIEVEKGTPQTITLNSPTPMYGSLNVNCPQIGVEVSIDGKIVGKAPKVFTNILVGDHTLKLTKSGYNPIEGKVTISEGKIYQYKAASMVAVDTNNNSQAGGDNNTAADVAAAKKLPAKIFTEDDYKAMGSPDVCIIPDGYTSIGDKAFMFCDNLTTIIIPNSVTSIGNMAFWLCTNLASINIPNSVTSIGEMAFRVCANLTSINIPNSVISIGNAIFSNLNEDCKITVNSIYFTYKNGVLFDKNQGRLISALDINTNYTIPNTVTSIGDGAFWCCDNLTTINIPNSVTSIGDYAFWYCDKLTTINIPNSVTSIGGNVFENCKNPKIHVSKSSPIYQQLKDISDVKVKTTK